MTRGETKVYATLRLTEPEVDHVDPAAKPVSPVQLMRDGTFDHGWYGKIQINDELFNHLIFNFDAGVRGIDIALDIEHQPERGAAGWFRRLYTNEGGGELWGEVEWTPQGRDLVESNIYKYLSIEYDLAYVDEEGVVHGPTMLGAALTNRPFIKNMRRATINLSETVDFEAFEEVEDAPELTEIALSEREEVLLSEVRQLRDDRRKLRLELRRLRVRNRLEEAKRQGKVTPAMEGWLAQLAEREDDTSLERVLATLPMRVRFEELGSAGGSEAEGDPTSALDTAVRDKLRQLREDDPDAAPTYADALAFVQREYPSLVGAYRRATR
ncbi:MAG: hypothetical protein O3A46_14585 [Candidatus Poribacteria bacterium]|nr:hypothetical protein [Candidatus Poribacteria bacterium]